MSLKVNWEKLWEDFEEWHTKNDTRTCKECGQSRRDLMPEWEDQMKKIKRLVDSQIRRFQR